MELVTWCDNCSFCSVSCVVVKEIQCSICVASQHPHIVWQHLQQVSWRQNQSVLLWTIEQGMKFFFISLSGRTHFNHICGCTHTLTHRVYHFWNKKGPTSTFYMILIFRQLILRSPHQISLVSYIVFSPLSEMFYDTLYLHTHTHTHIYSASPWVFSAWKSHVCYSLWPTKGIMALQYIMCPLFRAIHFAGQWYNGFVNGLYLLSSEVQTPCRCRWCMSVWYILVCRGVQPQCQCNIEGSEYNKLQLFSWSFLHFYC